ncbi:MAG: VanW family protein [Bacilli bacterium]|jgi:vancomycin resistance protein VanW|nr:VanW family protein [Bacilli bacterium]
MSRCLFCEISPLTYRISNRKEIILRSLKNLLDNNHYAKEYDLNKLPYIIYRHHSLIRRKLGNVDLVLQENKAINLSLSIPKVNGIIIKPQETFSFWKLVGSISKKKGYLDGVNITNNKVEQGTGGGLCQFTNLIHWLILHSSLDIVEHHHHDNIDLFPDFGRKVPFGCGTSISYNNLDYQFTNNTDDTFQLIVYLDEKYLYGELRCNHLLDYKYHIKEEEAYFYQYEKQWHRHNIIRRIINNKKTSLQISNEIMKENNALVYYDASYIDEKLINIKKTTSIN